MKTRSITFRDFKEQAINKNPEWKLKDFLINPETLGFDVPKTVTKRKKKEDKKPKDFGDTDNRAKKPKMDAYKKSGKKNLFFDDEDDDEEIDLFGLKGKEDDDWQSDDDDWEDDAFEDEDED